MNTTPLSEQWSMEGALDRQLSFVERRRALLLGERGRADQLKLVRLPVWNGDGDPPVLFRDSQATRTGTLSNHRSRPGTTASGSWATSAGSSATCRN